MTIYAKRINNAQRRALARFEAVSGFEPMGQEELDAGTATFHEVWYSNIQWLEDVLGTVSNIDLRGTGA